MNTPSGVEMGVNMAVSGMTETFPNAPTPGTKVPKCSSKDDIDDARRRGGS